MIRLNLAAFILPGIALFVLGYSTAAILIPNRKFRRVVRNISVIVASILITTIYLLKIFLGL